jgi:hypothetical protein
MADQPITVDTFEKNKVTGLRIVFIGEVCSPTESFQSSKGDELAAFSPGSSGSMVKRPLTLMWSRMRVFS